jgi:hypothetical protein
MGNPSERSPRSLKIRIQATPTSNVRGVLLAGATAAVTVAPFVLGGAVTTGETPVIGSLPDTAAYVGQEGYNVLFVPEPEYGAGCRRHK